jgi:hypothetical protein
MRDVLLAGWLGCAAVPLGAGSRLWHLPRQPLPTPMSTEGLQTHPCRGLAAQTTPTVTLNPWRQPFLDLPSFWIGLVPVLKMARIAGGLESGVTSPMFNIPCLTCSEQPLPVPLVQADSTLASSSMLHEGAPQVAATTVAAVLCVEPFSQ